MTALDYHLFYHNHLPHYQPPGATLFVTYRLAGSMPREVLERLQDEAEATKQMLQTITDEVHRCETAYIAQKRQFATWDAALDTACHGPLWLSQPELAAEVVSTLCYIDGLLVDLDSYCIMANHVHVIMTPLEVSEGQYHALQRIMHMIKRYSARKCNLLLKRTGAFWQHESYDHVVRDAAELLRVRSYVLLNPVKAGLVEKAEAWPWSYCKYGVEVGAYPPPTASR